MRDKRDCKIVQDLLPNYIEKLTSEESNILIQGHLKECKECKNILEDMQKDLDIDIQKQEKGKVNYIKKYNKKLRVLKVILLIILTIFIIRTGRNMIIMLSMSNKADKYIASNNYYRRSSSYNGEYLTILDYYYKEGKSKMVLTTLALDSKSKVTVYNNGETKNLYLEIGDKKTVQLDADTMTSINTTNYFKADNNILLFILGGMTANIKSAECNGKECYLVNNYFSDNSWGFEMGTYIDKSTGLIVRSSIGDSTNSTTGSVTSHLQDFSYNFGTVTDDIFVEPDITEYEIKK